MTNHIQKYSLIQRITFVVCLLACLFALIIIIWVPKTTEQLLANNKPVINEETQPVKVVDETVAATEAPIIETKPTEAIYKDDLVEIQTTEPQNIPVIEKIEDNLSEWCLSNENNDCFISLWKITDQEGNLCIALKNENQEILATFKYEGIETDYYDEWVLCDGFFEQTTIKDVGDYSFTSYHEVSGNNAENVQAQICVLINRQSCQYYPDSIRGVVTESKQYSCSRRVVSRQLKSDHFLEREDLEKCYRQTLLVLAEELIQEVPTNVVFAARGKQGSGIWKIIDGTCYCFL